MTTSAQVPSSSFKRILLKLSGEALMGGQDVGYDMQILQTLAQQIQTLVAQGTQVAIVMGGGNLFRGQQISHQWIQRTTADQMGMMATVMNGLALRDTLHTQGLSATLYNAFAIEGLADRFQAHTAKKALTAGHVVLISGGTSNPFFTTDSAAALRGIELEADVVIKATNVDGVYDKDPNQHADAIKYDQLTFQQAVTDGLKIMDTTAFVLCQENRLPIQVLNLFAEQALVRFTQGHNIGTLVHNG